MAANSDFPHDPRVLAKTIYDGAKLFWSVALALKVLSASLGVYFVLSGTTQVSAPWSIVVLAVLSELSQWRSDILKGRAEQLKRKIEFHDGLGWPLSPADISDYLARLSKARRQAIEVAIRENYFASTKDKSPGRAVENLQESSWWSKHLAGTMLILCSIIVAILVSASLLVLGLAVSATHEIASLENTSRVVSAVLALVVSFGAIRLLNGYFAFARKSEQIEEAAKTLTSGEGTPVESDVIKLIHDYQIARAAAPLIPDALWKAKRDGLNLLWDQYRRGS